MFRVHTPIIRSIRCWDAACGFLHRGFGWVHSAVARHRPHRTHDLRSGSQDHHPSKTSVQKTTRCISISNAPHDGCMYPKHVELRIHQQNYLVISSWHFTLFQEEDARSNSPQGWFEAGKYHDNTFNIFSRKSEGKRLDLRVDGRKRKCILQGVELIKLTQGTFHERTLETEGFTIKVGDFSSIWITIKYSTPKKPVLLSWLAV